VDSFSWPAEGAALHPVAAAASASTSALELAALGGVAGVGLGGAVGNTRGASEVLVHLASLERSADEHAVAASRGAKSELVEGDDLTAGGNDARAGSVGGTEAAHSELELAAVQKANVVGDGAHDNCNLASLAVHQLGKLSDGNWGPVGAAHEKTLENNSIEFTFRPTSQETVQLCTIFSVH
jgi:hypothetical protein